MVLASPGPLLPFFLPPEDPFPVLFPVLLRHNSTPLWDPDPAPARRPRQQHDSENETLLEEEEEEEEEEDLFVFNDTIEGPRAAAPAVKPGRITQA